MFCVPQHGSGASLLSIVTSRRMKKFTPGNHCNDCWTGAVRCKPADCWWLRTDWTKEKKKGKKNLLRLNKSYGSCRCDIYLRTWSEGWRGGIDNPLQDWKRKRSCHSLMLTGRSGEGRIPRPDRPDSEPWVWLRGLNTHCAGDHRDSNLGLSHISFHTGGLFRGICNLLSESD